MQLRVGLVGAGLMGRNHARVIKELGFDLVGVVDPDPAARKHVADRFGCPSHVDVPSLLKTRDLEAVVVAAPTSEHYVTARAALEAGKHVLIEKPITQTVAQARSLLSLSQRSGLVCSVGHIERHNPVVRWIKQKLAQDAYGRVISIHSQRLSPYPQRIRDVGVVLDLGIHDLDVLRHLVGREPTGIYANVGAHRKGSKVEDHASIMTEFGKGPSGITELSWLTPTKVRSLVLACEEGVVQCDYIEQSVTLTRASLGAIDPDNLFQIPVELSVERMALRREEPLRNEHLDFAQAIREGRPPAVGAQDGLAALQLAHNVLLSARARRRVSLETR